MTLTKPYEATFYIGDNSTKSFSFLFDEVSENFIKVIVKRIDGTIYTPTFSVDMELKEVVFGEDEITPTADDIICIYRDTPTIQDTQFNTLQGYNAKALENILSKIVAMIQEMKASGFSTQILQGEPWGLDLIKPADDGASVQIDYQARVLKKGLYFKMSDGNLQASANGVDFVQMPKSAEVKEFRHRLDSDGNVHFEYRVDKDWIAVSTGAYVSGIKSQVDKNTADIITINGKLSAVDTQIDANADAILKTREDFIAADSEIHQILNNHAENLSTLHNDVDDLGDQVAEIESKIPESASATNQLITKEDLKSIDLEGYATTEYVNAREQEIRDDINRADSELQSQITAQASAITANTTSINGVKAVIPDGTSETNPLINKQQLLAAETDIRKDMNQSDNKLQSQITAQAAKIAGKQDKLAAGDNIIISGNVISATSGGAGLDFIVVEELPETGQKGVVYLLAKDGEAPDVYDEYVWITATETFELIGSTKVDLSGYLPLSGGTMSGNLNIVGGKIRFGGNGQSPDDAFAPEIRWAGKHLLYVGDNTLLVDTAAHALKADYNNLRSLGTSSVRWKNVYTQNINNGADLAVPTEGGTLARLEDLENIGALPDHTGNAGKFLKTNGTKASWEDVPPSVTITLKEYDE